MPSQNVIQRPELLLKLRRALGLRQAHVTPTLNEGVQAVVVLADIDREERTPRDAVIGLSALTQTGGQRYIAYQLRVDQTADRIARVGPITFQRTLGAGINVSFEMGVVRNSVWEAAFPGAIDSGTAIYSDTSLSSGLVQERPFGAPPAARLRGILGAVVITLAGEPAVGRYRIGTISLPTEVLVDPRTFVIAPGFSLIVTGREPFEVAGNDGLMILWQWDELQVSR